MSHLTKDKGDLAVALVIADLTIKEYAVLAPIITEHLPFDLIAYKDGKCLRIQVKYSQNNYVSNKRVWSCKAGNHVSKYPENSFDYYAVYLPDIQKIVYPHFRYGGCNIAITIPNCATPFYWWEDFLEIKDDAISKHTYAEYGLTLVQDEQGKYQCQKVDKLSKEELESLIWNKSILQISKDSGISYDVIIKWCKSYGIVMPPRGYWNTKRSVKNHIVK